ncbi:MAG: S41 family peptidase [Phycisphaeraceae bacterium]
MLPTCCRSSFRFVLLSTLLLVSLLAVARSLGRNPSALEQIDLLVDIRHEIVTQYAETPDQQKMAQEAVRAMVGALDDPYTVYLSPEELEPFDKLVHGTFSGIGAEVDIHDDRLRIVTPLDGSPAVKAGVMAGDIVLQIDGVSTEGMKITDAIKRLTGPQGTQVTIKVRHPSGAEADLSITRAQINVQTVRGVRRGAEQKWDYMLDRQAGIGYIRLSQFTEKTPGEVRAALDELLAQNVKGLIVDVRFNPGGLLDAAVQIADMFLPADKTIVSVRGRVVPEQAFKSTNGGTIPDMPIVVLANEASASASEVLAGALADNGRAKFIGTRTFGKGSVQQVFKLDGGQGALKITNAYYYLPNGRNIHRRKDATVWGVDPDDGFYVTMTFDQVTEMVRLRSEADVLRPGDAAAQGATLTPEMIRKDRADPQLAAALEAILGKLRGGDWPKVGQSDAQALVRRTQRENLLRQRDAMQDRIAQINKELGRLDKGQAITTEEETDRE